MLAWLDSLNRGKPHGEQIHPFSFLVYYTARTGVFVGTADLESCVVDSPRRGRPRKAKDVKPIAPFNKDSRRAVMNAFDRVTGEYVSADQLKTYAEALCQYHLSSEDKFANAQFLDRGRTDRRHVVATGFVWIGKEANRVGETGEPDPIWSSVEEFMRGSHEVTAE
jgi:hypothetical protein